MKAQREAENFRKNAVPCYATPCYAMLCHAMLCYAMLRYAMLRYAMLCGDGDDDDDDGGHGGGDGGDYDDVFRLSARSTRRSIRLSALTSPRPQRRLFSTAPRRLFNTSICGAASHQGLNGGLHEHAPHPTNTTRVDVHLLKPRKVELIATDPAVPQS